MCPLLFFCHNLLFITHMQGQHFLSVQNLSKEQLNHIFDLAQTFRVCINKDRPLDHLLKVRRRPTGGWQAWQAGRETDMWMGGWTVREVDRKAGRGWEC